MTTGRIRGREVRARAAWIAAGGAIVVFVVAAALDPFPDPTATVVFAAAVAAFSIVGAILVVRVPGNLVGGLLLAAGVSFSAMGALGVYSGLAATAQPTPWPGAALAAVLSQSLFFIPIVIVLVGVPLVFPDGRLLSRRWRWIAWLTVAAMGALAMDALLRPGQLGAAEIVNPYAVPELLPLLDALNAFASLISVVAFGGAAVSVGLRYRRAGFIERQQLRWLVAVAAVGAIAFPASILIAGADVDLQPVADTFFLVGFLALIALPIAIGVAILRYRLYEIDRLVSRTIGWALVTATLIAVFAAGVIALQTVLAGFTQGQTLAVAASTLVAFALFQPLRRRVQHAVDRRFDRARYDGERTAAAFGARLRDATDLGGLEADVVQTVGLALKPSSTTIWIRNVRRNAEPGIS